MIEVCSLSSGSNGNAFFIKTGSDSFLVDAGISCKQITLRLKEIDSDVSEIKGIFITHEHSDHIRGLRVLLKKHPIHVYITKKTYRKSKLDLDENLLRFIQSSDRVSINGTEIQSLPKTHDAVDPSLFVFYYKDKKVSFITDAGYPCGNVIEAVRDANILFLESNYDEVMLREGDYPWFLKERIAGESGHLSNKNAASLVYDYGAPTLSHVFLSHLSENNNNPDVAMQTFRSVLESRGDLKHLQPLLTSRYSVSPIVKLNT